MNIDPSQNIRLLNNLAKSALISLFKRYTSYKIIGSRYFKSLRLKAAAPAAVKTAVSDRE